MAEAARARRRPASSIWRYTFKILTGSGYWVLIVPVAAMMIVSVWMMALANAFDQATADQIGEMMMPILGAFLVAHSLAPEYRSSIGAVLASKPVSLHRVLTLRVALGLIAPIVLTAVPVILSSMTLKAVDLVTPLAGGLPSLWFLSMLALTFATLFRNPLGGFAVAAGLWALDLQVGYSVHPLLSLQALHAREQGDPLSSLWLINKMILLIAGTALLLLHGRLLPRITRAAGRTDVVRMGACVALVGVLYAASGAAVMVGYAYRHRAHLPFKDIAWLRRQLKVYGPVPIAPLFGPAFATWVAPPPAALEGKPAAAFRIQSLRSALSRWPDSIWAAAIATSLGDDELDMDPTTAAKDYMAVADRFPSSPFAPYALVEAVRLDAGVVPLPTRMAAARRLLRDYPMTPEAERAAEQLREQYPADVSAAEMLRAALIAADTGPNFRRPGWLLIAAQVELQQNDATRAAELARQARQAGFDVRMLVPRDPNAGLQIIPHRPQIDGAIQDAGALLQRLGHPVPPPPPGLR